LPLCFSSRPAFFKKNHNTFPPSLATTFFCCLGPFSPLKIGKSFHSCGFTRNPRGLPHSALFFVPTQRFFSSSFCFRFTGTRFQRWVLIFPEQVHIFRFLSAGLRHRTPFLFIAKRLFPPSGVSPMVKDRTLGCRPWICFD